MGGLSSSACSLPWSSTSALLSSLSPCPCLRLPKAQQVLSKIFKFPSSLQTSGFQTSLKIKDLLIVDHFFLFLSVEDCHYIKIIINQKDTIQWPGEPQTDSKISTVNNHCQLITSLTKGCSKAILIPDKFLMLWKLDLTPYFK